MMNNRVEITWSIELETANQILRVLGKQPFDEVADTITLLRYQASTQLQTMQATQGPQAPLVPMKREDEVNIRD